MLPPGRVVVSTDRTSRPTPGTKRHQVTIVDQKCATADQAGGLEHRIHRGYSRWFCTGNRLSSEDGFGCASADVQSNSARRLHYRCYWSRHGCTAYNSVDSFSNP